MEQSELDILQEIIDSDGNCIKASRCTHCPLKDRCHLKLISHKDIYASYFADTARKERKDAAEKAICDYVLLNKIEMDENDRW